MTVAISVGSGKGGTGKSMVVANLATLMAKAGKRVCVVDLDLGGADIHMLFGVIKPEHSLTDFLARRVESINGIVTTLDSFYGLQLIAGTGETLHTANITFQEKQRLLRHLRQIDADVLLLDVGAGTSYHMLDFFMSSDIQLCVATPEPPTVMDLYKFIQLATVRKALAGFLSYSEVGKTLREKNFETLAEVYELADRIQPGARHKIARSLRCFQPLLVINKVGTIARINHLKLRRLAARYLGIELQNLGEIPEDTTVSKAIGEYVPVCEYDQASPSARALTCMSSKLIRLVELFSR